MLRVSMNPPGSLPQQGHAHKVQTRTVNSAWIRCTWAV